jgi:peroxiredoxin
MNLLTIGQRAPTFVLNDITGRPVSLQDYLGQPVLLNFWSAECPFVERVDRALSSLPAGAALLLVASNTNEMTELLRRVSQQRKLGPVLVDSDQSVADEYGAQTTPHFFLIDSQGILRYQGAFDDVSFRQRTPTRRFVVEAIEALQAGQDIEIRETPPYGCAVIRFSTD